MRLVCLSDTHGRHDELTVPEGDILIHAGDFTSYGSVKQVGNFVNWFKSQPHKHKVVVAGNHDFLFERNPTVARAMMNGISYLENSGLEIEGLVFYGSPYTPVFFDWAFNAKPEQLAKYWANIPSRTDVLITHGPPYEILDITRDFKHVGCPALQQAVKKLKPKYHIFGHIHEGYGTHNDGFTQYVNASVCDLEYRAVNKIQVFDTTDALQL